MTPIEQVVTVSRAKNEMLVWTKSTFRRNLSGVYPTPSPINPTCDVRDCVWSFGEQGLLSNGGLWFRSSIVEPMLVLSFCTCESGLQATLHRLHRHYYGNLGLIVQHVGDPLAVGGTVAPLGFVTCSLPKFASGLILVGGEVNAHETIQTIIEEEVDDRTQFMMKSVKRGTERSLRHRIHTP